MSALTVGVDVGGTSTRVGLVDVDGRLVAFAASSTPRSAEAVTKHVVAEVEAIVGRHHVAAIGLGIPGRVDTATGTVSMAVNLGIVDPLPLGRILEDRMSCRVVVGNDVDLAAVGAHAHLAGGADDSLVYLSIGTGFAAGLVLNGRLHRGVGGAGEIGHLPAPGGDLRCSCGQIGCVETLASGGGMLRAWGAPDGDIDALWNAADAGDELASSIRAAAIDTTAWVVQCTALLLDVDRIVIGGGVSRLGDRLLTPLITRLAERDRTSRLLPTYALAERVQLAGDDVEYGVSGAAATARAISAVDGADMNRGADGE